MRTGVASLLVLLPVSLPALAEGMGPRLPADDLVVEATVALAGESVAFGFDSLWVPHGRQLARIDPADGSVVEIPLSARDGRFRTPAIGEGAVWVGNVVDDTICKVDPALNAVALRIPAAMLDSEGTIGVGSGSVWAITRDEGSRTERTLSRFDAASGTAEARIPLPAGGTGIAVVDGSVWVTSPATGQLYQVDAGSNALVATVRLGGEPGFIAAGEGALWVANGHDGTVQRVDPASGRLAALILTGTPGRPAGDIAVGGGFVWLSSFGAPLTQIDPVHNRTVARYEGGVAMGDAVRFGAGSLWISGTKLFRIAPPGRP